MNQGVKSDGGLKSEVVSQPRQIPPISSVSRKMAEQTRKDKRKRELIYYQCHIPLVFTGVFLLQLFIRDLNWIEQYPGHTTSLYLLYYKWPLNGTYTLLNTVGLHLCKSTVFPTDKTTAHC